MGKAPDWIAIEGHYTAGVRSLRDIAQEYGIAEGTIRHRAKKNSWVQDAAGTKRQMVSKIMSGVTQDVTRCAMRNIEEAAKQDAEDMNLGLMGARKALARSVGALDEATEPRDIKTLSECIKLNVETIRTIRELDKAVPGQATDGIQVNVIFQQAIA